jgi:hypothetical protein
MARPEKDSFSVTGDLNITPIGEEKCNVNIVFEVTEGSQPFCKFNIEYSDMLIEGAELIQAFLESKAGQKAPLSLHGLRESQLLKLEENLLSGFMEMTQMGKSLVGFNSDEKIGKVRRFLKSKK